MSDELGFFPLWRRFFKHPFWKEKRAFSKAEAWIDILRSAHFSDEPIERFISNKLITIKYGETVMTTRYCGERWGWTQSRVFRFIKLLKNMEQIAVKSNRGVNHIIIINFAKYDPRRITDESDANHTRIRRESDANQIKELENYNTGNNSITSGENKPPTWKTDFEIYKKECEASASRLLKDKNWLSEQQELNPNVDIYLTMKKAYLNYWGTKEAWKKKKSQKIKSINWKSLWQNAISNSFNRVYKDQSKSQSRVDKNMAASEAAKKILFGED